MTHPRLFAEATPDKPAIILAGTGLSVTYGELEARANQYAHLLRALELRAGDCIAIWLENRPEFLEIFWGAQRAGLYVVPLSVHLGAEEARYILQDSGAQALFTSAGVAGADALAAQWRDALPGLRMIASVGPEIAGCRRSEAWLATFHTGPIEDETSGRPFVYSSGTTGRPKGIRLPLSGLAPTAPDPVAERLSRLHDLGEQTVFLAPAPLYHTSPLVFSTTVHRAGGTVVLMPKFDPQAALEAVQQHRVDFTVMVPTMFLRLLRLPEPQRRACDLSSLRRVVHAAAPCPVEVKQQMIDWLGPIVWEFYSGSEGVGSTLIDSHEWLRKPGSVGRAQLGTLHVAGPFGEALAPNETGLIYFETGVKFEYFGDPEKTRQSRHPEHDDWVTLGDIGYVDQDGYLFLTDRKSFMIISGGVNIYPQEAENLLAAHPAVADVAVFGVPDLQMGEAVKAVVQPLDWSQAGPQLEQELIAWCRSRLAALKCPRSIDFDPALPRDDSGKLHKRRLRDRYWGDRAARISG
jgi:acyl-CoA synthetase (AMP-forming)/AMP-acid ligase II